MKFGRHFSSYQIDDEDSMDFEHYDEERQPLALKIRKGGRAGKSKVLVEYAQELTVTSSGTDSGHTN